MRNTLLVTFILLSSLKIRAQQNPQARTYQFNLKECLEYAYENQDSLKNAKLDIESARYKVKETTGLGLPQISGSANLQHYLKVPVSVVEARNFDPSAPPGELIGLEFAIPYASTAGLNVNQLLFDGSYLVGLKASKTFKELSEKNYNRTKIATTVAVTKAYYQVLISNEQMRLLDANIKQLAQQLKETTELNKQGFVEKIDLDRLRVLYNNLITTRGNTERLLVLSTQVLKFQIGMPITDNLQVKDKISDTQIEVQASIPTDTSAYKNRIEYSLLQTQRDLNELNVKRIRAQNLPSLSAFGSAAYQYYGLEFGKLYNKGYAMSLVGLQLNVPIFSGFQRLNQYRQAKIEVQKSNNILNNVKNGILLQQEQARITYENGLASLNNQKSNMEVAREVLRVSKIKYHEGVGSSLEVIQAQTALEQAENNYIQALYDALVSKVDLDNAYGRIQ